MTKNKITILTASIILSGMFGVFYMLFIPGVYAGEQNRNVYILKNCEDLRKINNDLDGIYIQANDIDCGVY